MIIQIKVGNSLKEIVLKMSDVNEFQMKWESIGDEVSLDEFISNDIKELLVSEIEDGKYGLFNY